MHSLVRRFIKTAFAFLFVGLTIGLWMIAERELGHRTLGPYVTSAHTHAILVGFVMMLILGVALWLFPRADKSDTQYKPERAEAAYWLITTGTAVRVAGELVRSRVPSQALGWAIVLSSIAQIAALLLFAYTMWPRIRGLGSVAREAKGERF